MHRLHRFGFRYGAALGLSGLALAARLIFTTSLGLHAPFVTFYVAVVIASVFLGLGPAVLVAGCGGLSAAWFFFPPIHSFSVASPTDTVWIVFYVTVVATIIIAINAQQRALRRLRSEISLRERAQRAEAEQRQWYEITLRSIGDAVIATDEGGRITFMNAVAETLTGWTSEQARDRPIGEVFVIRNEGTDTPAEVPVDRVLREGIVAGLANHTLLLNRGGRVYPIDDSAAPIRHPDGSLAGVVLVFRDISERRQAELAIERHAGEMERFAYLASHDLREPLRTVSSFTTLLQRQYADALDATAREYIAYILSGTRRMQTLITDLMEYCRSGATAISIGTVSADDMLHDALEALRSDLEASGTQVTSDPLPVIVADRVKLTQVFQNLIGNAVKFRSERPCKVHVSAEQKEGFWQFEISDNGIGFDEQGAGRIFDMFQTLHSRERFPGSGIGLAISKRVIESHNGRIWARSRPGEGSTFTFTVPVAAVRPVSAAAEHA